MSTAFDTSVLIVGAGPVGLTLAMDLAWRGVDVVVVESRERGEPPSVKCNHVAARSMEIFRRLGVASAVRDTGLPPDYPHDVSYRLTTTGPELTRIHIPARQDRFTATDGPDTGWPTPEPPHRINQIYLEPVLFSHAEQMPGLEVFNRTVVEEVSQDGQGAAARLRDLDTGETRTLRARFLVGCDGGRSMVRKTIGAKFEGDAVVQRVQSTLIRAPQLIGMMQVPPAWSMFSLNLRRSGNIYSIDGKELWLVHNYLREEEADFDAVDRDLSIRQIIGVGPEFEYEVVSNEDWFGRRLVANRFRKDRIFVCGDAAHIWVPYAGYGMNAGIADAANLAWLLAAHLDGWAPYAILEAHEAERQPITEQVSHFAMNHAHQMASQRRSVPGNIEAAGPEGDAARAELGQRAYDLNVQQYCCAGLNFGYYYDASPLIAYDGVEAPGYSMADYTPSTVPGCRVPHVWLSDGRSLYDVLGAGYSLLRFDLAIDVSTLENAATEQGVPFVVLDLTAEESAAQYPHKLLIARPDQHVAWRGDTVPEDPANLIALLRGNRVFERDGMENRLEAAKA
ncbi:FAD-dependent oxidoreductase [Aquicoccus sp. G2-2]|uniref:FAD-dependent oxidoreductase n=1 Tax=Aquicoccus sp. G2-2 TaxID=3092120 RepID=UPI002ADFE275|nr:FAD-dependent oxidoreductase [Aquicoccus sp. G2-2]MEA1114822.1 FAD-dependent oxidoreductase [Aquicoccus sp. G2-2]